MKPGWWVACTISPDTQMPSLLYELITRLRFQQVKTDAFSSFVIATQGEDDDKALELALKQQYAYIGFVASKKCGPVSLNTYCYRELKRERSTK
jgi:xanthine/CO dehydrogenase XdhC/CoxF family maturation factor